MITEYLPISRLDKAETLTPEDLFIISTPDDGTPGGYKTNSADLSQISETVSNLLELGEMAKKDNLVPSDIPNFTHEKITDLGDLALSNFNDLRANLIPGMEDILTQIENTIQTLSPRLRMISEEDNGSGILGIEDGYILSCEPTASTIVLALPREDEDFSRNFAYVLKNTGTEVKPIRIVPFSDGGGKTTRFVGDNEEATRPVEPGETILLWFREIGERVFLLKKTVLSTIDTESGYYFVTKRFLDISTNEPIDNDETIPTPYKAGSEYIVPSSAPTYTDYAFRYWTDSSGHELSPGTILTVDDNITIRAMYKKDDIFHVRFWSRVDDGLTGEMDPQGEYVIRNKRIFLDGEEVDSMSFPDIYVPGYRVEWDPPSIPDVNDITEDLDFIATLTEIEDEVVDGEFVITDKDGNPYGTENPIFLSFGRDLVEDEIELFDIGSSGNPVYLEIS